MGRSVQPRVGRNVLELQHRGQQRAADRLQDALPKVGPLVEHLFHRGRHGQPRPLGKLLFELARSPAGMTDEDLEGVFHLIDQLVEMLLSRRNRARR